MKTAVVTGGSRGIGFECARRLLERGYTVAAVYNNSEREAHRLEPFGDVRLYRADLSVPQQATALGRELCAQLPRIDVIVNNAGVSCSGLITDMSDEQLISVMNTNATSMLCLTRALLPRMLAAHSGRIINISSMWGVSGSSCEVAYSASKAAIIGFTRALALELAPSGITVNCIAPGVIDTDMMADYTADERLELARRTPAGRLGTPDDVAAAVMFLTEDAAGYITGQTLGVNGGFVV